MPPKEHSVCQNELLSLFFSFSIPYKLQRNSQEAGAKAEPRLLGALQMTTWGSWLVYLCNISSAYNSFPPHMSCLRWVASVPTGSHPLDALCTQDPAHLGGVMSRQSCEPVFCTPLPRPKIIWVLGSPFIWLPVCLPVSSWGWRKRQALPEGSLFSICTSRFQQGNTYKGLINSNCSGRAHAQRPPDLDIQFQAAAPVSVFF